MKTKFLLFYAFLLAFSTFSLETTAKSRPSTGTFNIDQPSLFQDAETNGPSYKTAASETIRSGNIPFPIQSSNLSNDAKIILNGIATDLKSNLTYKAIIKGHGGGDRTIGQLADDRIYSVITYMSETHQLGSERFETSVDTEEDTDTLSYSLQSDSH